MITYNCKNCGNEVDLGDECECANMAEQKTKHTQNIKSQDDFNKGVVVGCIIAPTLFFAAIGVIYTIRWLLQ